jgi:hypothetical protein
MAGPVPVFHGVVTAEGKLLLEARDLFRHYVQRLKNQPVQLVLKRQVRVKSRSQLGFLWGVLYPVIAEALGYCAYEMDALHDAIMREVRGLRPEPNPLQLRVSLSQMSHEEVSDYISDVRFWALDRFNIVTPEAGQMEAA